MPSDIVIDVENASKIFCRNLKRSLRYGIGDIARELLGRRHSRDKLRKDEFWALRDISFRLRRGECLGLIGGNGAGKTTLLKTLNGLIKPDAGRLTVRGRVGALIALGAGFNPILTGRENIYINGTVLGLTKRDIDEKFDEIVDFADLSDFIDAPVKTYSSGMHVRLGFAIAAQTSPDILLIDEVLAVGDFAFRGKCLNRLNQLCDRGTGFILVSHCMTSVLQFCHRTIWMDSGRIKMDGPSAEVIGRYTEHASASQAVKSTFGDRLTDHPDIEQVEVKLRGATPGSRDGEIRHGESAVLDFSFKTRHSLNAPNVSFPICKDDGTLVGTLASISRQRRWPREGDCYVGSVRFGPLVLTAGTYTVIANFHDGREHLYRAVVATFRVVGVNRMTWGTMEFEQEWLPNRAA